MPLFGEIVIPSSRALWDEESEEIDEINANISLMWDCETSFPSEKIETLLIIESKKLIELAQTCLLDDKKPICKIDIAKVSVYKFAKNEYMILFEENEVATPGELTEVLIPWIQKSKKIITFNSLPAVTYQSSSSEEKPSCFIRTLSTSDILFAEQLEAPNLATGVTAGILSYCYHIGLPASLYICYLEPRPLDSITAEPILNILKKLFIPILKPFRVKKVDSDNNLYM